MHILIVEDTAVTRTLLQRSLEKWDYTASSVSNSQDALVLLQQGSIQFVITDWVMPGGDGPTLCRAIRALQLPFYTYIILVTSLDSEKSVIEGLEAGADDFIRKPIQLDELHARIRAGERVLALEKTLQDKNTELVTLSTNLVATQDLLNRELIMAAKVQKALLPAVSTRFFDITIDWLFVPSKLISGDLFNFLRLDETHVGFYTLDVAGHGVTSAMMAFTLSHLLSSELHRGSPLKRKLLHYPFYEITPPNEVMAELNARFQIDAHNWLYFTMIYGVIDTVNQRIALSQAGHPNPIFFSRDQSAKFLGDGGFPIGLTPDACYDEISIAYKKGDRLVLYSDGITECVGINGDMFGPERLLEFLDTSRSLPVNEVPERMNEKIRAWRGAESFEDDISLFILQLG